MQKKIYILQRILPHYRTGFFNKLKNYYPGLKVFYGDTYKTEVLKNAEVNDKDTFAKVKNHYFNKDGKIFYTPLFSRIVKEKPDIVVSVFNVGNLNIYLLFLLRYFLKYKLVLWSLGYDHLTGFYPDKILSHKIRLYLSQKADAVIFYWDYGKKVVEKYSKKTSHYFVAPNTIDTDMHFAFKEKFDIKGKEKIKAELEIKENFIIIYVGRLIRDKEVDTLIKAYALIEKSNTDSRLIIIGDGPERKELESLASRLQIKNISFPGEILNQEITGRYLYISDVFAMPGRLGNSVVHSFCYGTPVVSVDKGDFFHCEGISYIKEGFNGFLAEDRNIEDFYSKMNKIISDKNLSGNLRLNAFKTAKEECSLDKMVDGFRKALENL